MKSVLSFIHRISEHLRIRYRQNFLKKKVIEKEQYGICEETGHGIFSKNILKKNEKSRRFLKNLWRRNKATSTLPEIVRFKWIFLFQANNRLIDQFIEVCSLVTSANVFACVQTHHSTSNLLLVSYNNFFPFSYQHHSKTSKLKKWPNWSQSSFRADFNKQYFVFYV